MSMIVHAASSLFGRFYEENQDELMSEYIFIADFTDAADFQHLFKPRDQEMFNVESLEKKIHECYLTLGIKNKLGDVVGAICIAEYPNVPGIPMDDWVGWLAHIYGLKDVSSYNSFWIHLSLFDEAYAYVFLSALLKRLFEKHKEKKYVLLVVPPDCFHQVSWMEGFSTLILPVKSEKYDKVQALRLFLRQNFVTNYKIRRAVEEDNDDLVPLIDKFSPRLREMYGNYYIAEILTRHKDSGRYLIVAEYKNLAVAVLCLNGNVNYKELQKGFDLTIFNNLQKTFPTKSDSLFCTESTISRHNTASAIEKISNKSPSTITKTKSYDDLKEIVLRYNSVQEKSYFTLENDDYPLMFDSLSFQELESEKSKSLSKISYGSFSTFSVSYTQYSEFVMNGDENAFVIEIAAAEAEHVSSLFLLLEASFECFPDRDYCIISIPTTKPYLPMLKYFRRAPLKKNCYHEHELYITHRCIFNPILVKVAEKSDEISVKNFGNCIRYSKKLFEHFEAATKECSSYKMFLLYSGIISNMPFGAAVVNSIDDLEYLKRHYNLQKWVNLRTEKDKMFGVIEYFCMSPIFQPFSKFILREVHRKSGYTTLFYAINRHDAAPYRSRPFPTVLANLRNVKSKNKILTKDENGFKPEPFALYISTPRLTGSVKHEINIRIVVVGASYTSIAFLRTLLYSTNKKYHFVFNNVTIISPHGICHNSRPNKILDSISARTSTIDFDYMERLSLRSRVNVVFGEVTGINRRDKLVTVDEKSDIPYDMLFIMTGLQYNVPRNFKDISVKNMFFINTEVDATNALAQLKTLIFESETKKFRIVIYGCTIDAYCCIKALLEFGVRPENLTLIEPIFLEDTGRESHDFVFQDGDVYETVINYIHSLNVEVITGYKLTGWFEIDDGIAMQFESMQRFVEINALAVFMYPAKSVNFKVYEAIIRSGLVFDGRLVINYEFKTNDPDIYAAGPVTKYSRKYYSDHLLHRYFNSEEIGEDLGRRVRKFLIPVDEKKKSYDVGLKSRQNLAFKNLVPFFERPLITYCELPGGLFYLNVCKPGVPVPLETAMSDDDYGTVLITGDCSSIKDQGYFRLHLNPFKIIETITCLSVKEFDWKKLIMLWGKHERLLNSLVLRFEQVSIDDLFQYFDEPWCTAIFHDEFPDLENEIMRIMRSSPAEGGSTPYTDLLRIFEENGFVKPSKEEWDGILSKLSNSPFEKLLKETVLNFIRDNLASLDMYSHPVLVNMMLSRFQESFLFKEI